MKHAIGLDIGGTKILGILMDENGKILKRKNVETNSGKSSREIIGNVCFVVDFLLRGFSAKKISGIGIGCAGITDGKGKFLFSPNIPSLKGVSLKSVLSRRYNMRVVHENDANCFAIAEHAFGAGKGTGNMVGLIVGTGIGGGIILENKLYKGTNGFSGEFGHSVIDPYGPKCNCGLNGDFESLCSGPAIVKRYIALGGKISKPNPAKIFSSKEKVARNVVKDTFVYFGIGLSHIINGLDVETIVFGGGVSNIDFYDEINKSAKRFSNEAVRNSVRILRNMLGDDSGAVGAAALIMDLV